MIRYAFFQPLAPDAHFPQTAFNLTLNRVDYCLPIPNNVVDFLLLAITIPDTFDCLEHYSNSLGIDVLHHRPEAFEPHRNRPTYAETMLHAKTPYGSNMLTEFVFNSLAANEIVRLAEKGVIKDKDALRWVIENRKFFEHSGGFAFALGHYAFEPTDFESDDGVIHVVTDDFNPNPSKLGILRQLQAASEARS